MRVTIGGGILLFIFYRITAIQQSQNTLCRVKPYLFFELHCSYCFNPNTYKFNEELINWDYKGFRLEFENFIS